MGCYPTGDLVKPEFNCIVSAAKPELRSWRRDGDGSAGFRACGFGRLSSRQLSRHTGQECPVNPQTGMSALHTVAAASQFQLRRPGLTLIPKSASNWSRSAGFQPAGLRIYSRACPGGRPADWKSAIRQVGNLALRQRRGATSEFGSNKSAHDSFRLEPHLGFEQPLLRFLFVLFFVTGSAGQGFLGLVLGDGLAASGLALQLFDDLCRLCLHIHFSGRPATARPLRPPAPAGDCGSRTRRGGWMRPDGAATVARRFSKTFQARGRDALRCFSYPCRFVSYPALTRPNTPSSNRIAPAMALLRRHGSNWCLCT